MVLGLVLPILAVLLLGARAGIVVGVAVTAIVTAALAVDAPGMHPAGTAHFDDGYRASMTLSFGWVALACILGYEHQRVALQARLQQALHRLSESATQDPLTRVSNRRYLAKRLAAELAHAVRHGEDFGVIIFDLDHFKRINDTHGHEAGDHVLVEVARRVRDSLREEDVLARYGGEEFVVLTRAGLTGLRRLAERLRVVVACEPIRTPSEGIGVTLSAGCATWRASAASTADGILRVADECLYTAKAQGRNRVVAVDDPEAPPSTCSPLWLTRVSKGASLPGFDGERTVEGAALT
jgi:diguanylate cyclase (GGDEF)-like protein